MENKIDKRIFLFTILIGLSLFIGCTPQPCQINGVVFYHGEKGGKIFVTAKIPNIQDVKNSYSVTANDRGQFQINVQADRYILSAFLDIDNDNNQSLDEPFGFYDGNDDGKPDELLVNNIIGGIVINLRDQ